MSKLILLVDNVIINNNIDGIGSVGRSPDPHFLLYERKCLPSLSFVWWWIINIFLSLLFGTFPFYIYDNYMNVRIIDINVWPQIEWLRCLYMCLCLYMSVDIGKNVEKQSKAFFPFIRMVWMRWREIELQQHTQTPSESWPKKPEIPERDKHTFNVATTKHMRVKAECLVRIEVNIHKHKTATRLRGRLEQQYNCKPFSRMDWRNPKTMPPFQWSIQTI